MKTALEFLANEVRSATSSMTSVPKPLKFLRPHYETLKRCHATKEKSTPTSRLLADLLAVLAMTMSKSGMREILLFKTQGSTNDLGSWGHEFVRALAGEVGAEYSAQQLANNTGDFMTDSRDLIVLVNEIVPCSCSVAILISYLLFWLTACFRFYLQHNAHAEAVDLLIETQSLPKLLENYPAELGKALVDDGNFQRVCLYLLRCGTYMADPDDLKQLRQCAFRLYERYGDFPAALAVALQIGDDDENMLFAERCNKLFETADKLMQMQMAFLPARHRSNFEYTEDGRVDSIIGNNKLRGYYV